MRQPSLQPYSKVFSSVEEAYCKKIVLAGSEAIGFGDATQWQKDQREDRVLPWNL